MIAGSGMPMDAVVSDFVAGAAEMLSPDAAPDHWDVIEGQGSLFHPAYAGVSLGLLHGSQPDVIVVCHEPGRDHLLGYPHFPTPSLPDAIALHLEMGSLTNPKIRCAGVSFNTGRLDCSRGGSRHEARIGAHRPSGRGPDPRRPDVRSPRRGLPRLMARSTWFQRFLLPGFAFKAVVIGGGYATGRELAEFFVSVGPQGGLLAMALSTLLFSLICVVTFLFARMHGSTDYRSFFRNLVGPFWVVFEAAYMFSFILILAVYGAAAGAIGVAMFGWPPLAGVMCLIGSIAAFTMFGNASVEWLFKYASFFLYGVYALFVFFTLRRFGAEAMQGLAVPAANDGWVLAGVTYTGYNVLGRRGDPAGPASPDQHAGRRHCGPARGTAHDDRGRCFSSCA